MEVAVFISEGAHKNNISYKDRMENILKNNVCLGLGVNNFLH